MCTRYTKRADRLIGLLCYFRRYVPMRLLLYTVQHVLFYLHLPLSLKSRERERVCLPLRSNQINSHQSRENRMPFLRTSVVLNTRLSCSVIVRYSTVLPRLLARTVEAVYGLGQQSKPIPQEESIAQTFCLSPGQKALESTDATDTYHAEKFGYLSGIITHVDMYHSCYCMKPIPPRC